MAGLPPPLDHLPDGKSVKAAEYRRWSNFLLPITTRAAEFWATWTAGADEVGFGV